MRRMILGVLFTVVFLASTALAQTNPIQITGGRFFIKGSIEEPNNARIETANFTTFSRLGGVISAWSDICAEPICRGGGTFTVAPLSFIGLGTDQHRSGTITINGTTYENVFFEGYYNLSQVNFFIPKIARRKGLMEFRKPFTMTGRLKVCKVQMDSSPCSPANLLFDGDVQGHGTLTAAMRIAVYNNLTYLQKQSFDYQFEP